MPDGVTIDQILVRNSVIAKSHNPSPHFAEFPALGLNLPQTMINLVVVLRNTCGHVAPILNDIITLDRVVQLQEIMIVHHTDCGALSWRDEDVRADLKKAVPDAIGLENMSFGGITDLEQSVKDDFAVLAASPFVRKELLAHTRGFIYDIKTGELSPVQL